MSECRRFESTFESLLAGDLDGDALAPLLAHGRTCEDCRRLLELHGALEELGSRAGEPDEAELDRRQERVLREARRGRARRPLRIAAIAAGVAVPFVVGLLAGRSLPRPSRLIETLGAEAASNRVLADVEDSRFTYSNVAFRRLEGDTVALAFDVTTHLEVIQPVRSELVREVLAQALLDPSSIGTRLKAMSLAAGELDPKLEDAIVFALGHDESLGVRLEALAVLSGHLDDPDVQSAVMAALRDDPSVQVRLLALESLASHRVDHGRIRDVIRGAERPGDEALMVRLAEYEKKP